MQCIHHTHTHAHTKCSYKTHTHTAPPPHTTHTHHNFLLQRMSVLLVVYLVTAPVLLDAFYVPGVAPADFFTSDVVEIKVP